MRHGPFEKPWRFDWRRTSADLQFAAEGFWLRAESVLTVASGLDSSQWTDGELEEAMTAVAQAYYDREWAGVLDDVAFGMRLQGFQDEQRRRHERADRAA